MRKPDRFVLHASNSSTTLFHLHNDDVKGSYSLDTPRKSASILDKFPSAPIHILVDYYQLITEKQPIPFLNPIDLWSWYKTKIQEWNQTHPLNTTKIIRQNGRWYLQRIAVDPKITPWLHWLKNQDNPQGAVGALPYEIYPVLEKLQNNHRWQMILTLHQGGYMNVILYDQGQLLHSCHFPLKLGGPPKELAQEILEGIESTLHQLCTQTPDLLEKVNVFCVVDEETQRHLRPRILAPHQFHTLTPYQLSVRLRLPGKAHFRYSDQLIIRHWLLQWKKVRSLQSQLLKQTNFYKNITLTTASLFFLMGVGYYVFLEDSSPQTTYQSTPSLSHQIQKTPEPDIYLGSLIYVDKNHWTAWINNEPIRAHEPHSLDITNINSRSLEFNHNGERVTLAPHQTYWPSENQIVTGDQRRTERPTDSPSRHDLPLPPDTEDDRWN